MVVEHVSKLFSFSDYVHYYIGCSIKNSRFNIVIKSSFIKILETLKIFIIKYIYTEVNCGTHYETNVSHDFTNTSTEFEHRNCCDLLAQTQRVQHPQKNKWCRYTNYGSC